MTEVKLLPALAVIFMKQDVVEQVLPRPGVWISARGLYVVP